MVHVLLLLTYPLPTILGHEPTFLYVFFNYQYYYKSNIRKYHYTNMPLH